MSQHSYELRDAQDKNRVRTCVSQSKVGRYFGESAPTTDRNNSRFGVLFGARLEE